MNSALGKRNAVLGAVVIGSPLGLTGNENLTKTIGFGQGFYTVDTIIDVILITLNIGEGSNINSDYHAVLNMGGT